MNKWIIVAILAVTTLGCVSTKSIDIMTEEKIIGQKVIAISGTRYAWVFEIEKRLRESGFKIKRMVSQHSTIEQVTDKKTRVYDESSSRFVMIIDGYAPNNSFQRCFGGGFNFDFIDVELVDIEKNETVFHYSNSGYSEDCPPLSGTIFGDIVELTNSAWD
ncbi:MAG: hypothetical protein AB2821_10320 [Candidatus Thiodiazotropha endolucinida]